MYKFISWNIDSLNAALTSSSSRAILTQNVLTEIKDYNPDVIAIQETKLPADGPSMIHLEKLNEYFPAYKIEWVSSVEPARKGYAGTMFIIKPGLEVTVNAPKIWAPDTMDYEGRLLTAEFDDFYLVNVYTPNAGDGLKRLKDRMAWDKLFCDYLCELDKRKAVIACGDFNVAHKEIDLANPASNHMSAGFTDEEREGFSNLLSAGFTDSFRYLNGDVENVYSWWSQRIRTSKINNSGWRIDYYILSNRIADKIKKAKMLDSGERADHTPIILEIDI